MYILIMLYMYSADTFGDSCGVAWYRYTREIMRSGCQCSITRQGNRLVCLRTASVKDILQGWHRLLYPWEGLIWVTSEHARFVTRPNITLFCFVQQHSKSAVTRSTYVTQVHVSCQKASVNSPHLTSKSSDGWPNVRIWSGLVCCTVQYSMCFCAMKSHFFNMRVARTLLAADFVPVSDPHRNPHRNPYRSPLESLGLPWISMDFLWGFPLLQHLGCRWSHRTRRSLGASSSSCSSCCVSWEPSRREMIWLGWCWTYLL